MFFSLHFKLLLPAQLLWLVFSEGAVWSCAGEINKNHLTESFETEIGKEISSSFCIETDKDTIAKKFSIQPGDVFSSSHNNNSLVEVEVKKKQANIKVSISNIKQSDFKNDVVITLFARENNTRNKQDLFRYTLKLINKGAAQIEKITEGRESTAVVNNNKISRTSYPQPDLHETDFMGTSSLSKAEYSDKQKLFSTFTTYISTKFQSQTQSIIERNTGILNLNSRNEPNIPPNEKANITVGEASTADKVIKNTHLIDSETNMSESSNKTLTSERAASSTALLSKKTPTTWSTTSFAIKDTTKETYRPKTSFMPQITVTRAGAWPYAVTIATTIKSVEECHQIDSKVSHIGLSKLKSFDESLCLLIRSNSSTTKSWNECAPYGGRIARYNLIRTNIECIRDILKKENISCLRYFDPSTNYIGLMNITSVQALAFCKIYGVLCTSTKDKTEVSLTERITATFQTTSLPEKGTTVLPTSYTPTLSEETTSKSNWKENKEKKPIEDSLDAGASELDSSQEYQVNPSYFGISAAGLMLVVCVVVIIVVYRRRRVKYAGSLIKHGGKRCSNDTYETEQATYANIGGTNVSDIKSDDTIFNYIHTKRVQCDIQEQINLTDQDSGRVISDEGLVYVTVVRTDKVIRAKPKRIKSKETHTEDTVEYTTLDFDKSGELMVSADSEREEIVNTIK